MVLDIHTDELDMRGKLTFDHLTPWPKSIVSPGIMGWYTWVPFMECYHGIVSLDHEIQGSLVINNLKIDFSGGIGYTEKDWGRSFPKAWVWFQSNHFRSASTSITASIAIIPWIRKPFLGFIIGLWHQNQWVRLATYTGAKLVRLEISDSKVIWIVQQGEYVLEMGANRLDESLLHAPSTQGMNRRIAESLNSNVEIKLMKIAKEGRKTLFQDTGRHAGFEVGGDVRRLLEMSEKQRIKEK
jgi:hypothetical protein